MQYLCTIDFVVNKTDGPWHISFSSQQAAIFAIPRPAGDNLMTWVTNLQCSGTESSILTCPFTGMAVACQSGQDVGINCRPNPDPGPGPGPSK